MAVIGRFGISCADLAFDQKMSNFWVYWYLGGLVEFINFLARITGTA
jgi:hypothetical protein